MLEEKLDEIIEFMTYVHRTVMYKIREHYSREWYPYGNRYQQDYVSIIHAVLVLHYGNESWEHTSINIRNNVLLSTQVLLLIPKTSQLFKR